MGYESVDILKDREEKILEFIKSKQGCNKQDIVDYANKEGISSRNTTWNIIENLEKQKIIRLKKPKLNSRDFKIELIEDNPISKLYIEILEIKTTFTLLVEKILKEGNNTANLYAPNTEYNIKVKIISLLSCILKLINSIINEILIYHLSKIIKYKDDLVKEYNYCYAKMSEIHLSFDRLKKILDEKSLYYLPIFAKRNDTPSKTFLWSVMIFYETKDYQHYFIYTKDFRKQLFSLMNLIYNFGKKYSTSIYDEIVYDSSTYSNHLVCFPSAIYIQPLQDELVKLDYRDYIRLLIERCIEIKSLLFSDPVKMIKEIEFEIGKKNPVINDDNLNLSIFENMIKKVIEYLQSNNPLT